MTFRKERARTFTLLSVHHSTLSVISNHLDIQCHFYAEKKQYYLSFSPKLTSSAFSTIESCIRDVFSWLTSNKLSVNPNKTKYLPFNPKNINLPANIINLGSNTISPSDSAKNLGVTDMSMNKHISFIVKSCFLQLCDYCRIRPFISKLLLSNLLATSASCGAV